MWSCFLKQCYRFYFQIDAQDIDQFDLSYKKLHCHFPPLKRLPDEETQAGGPAKSYCNIVTENKKLTAFWN